MRDHEKQLALFSADTRFVLVVCSLFSSGLAAELGTTAVVVFLVLRSSANFQTGLVYLGLREISRQAGISVSTTRRALTELERRGLIARRQPHPNGRTIYTLTDQLPVFQRDEKGEKQPAGTLAIPFVPQAASRNLEEARAALVRGVVPQGSPVVLNLTINLVQHTGTGDVIVNNAGSSHFHTGQLPPETVAWFSRMIAEASPPEGEGNK